MFLTDFFSPWMLWKFLISFLFCLATGASLGLPLPTRPILWTKRFKYLFGLVQNYLTWFLFYLDFWKLSQLIVVLCEFLNISLTDFFSLWICWSLFNWFLFYVATGASLGHPFPTRPPFWKKQFTYLFGFAQNVLS